MVPDNNNKKSDKFGGCDLSGEFEFEYMEFFSAEDRETSLARPSVLLHACCAPCSTACVERLVPDFDVTLFFYNPNITDEEEYLKRRAAIHEFVEKVNADTAYKAKISLIEGEYDPHNFLAAVKGLEKEPEGGARCTVCFDLRLEATAERAKFMNFDYFATTLTVSPHKDYDTISAIGRRLAMQYDVSYLDMNFKKKDGFKRSVELSKKYDLYRQNFCGCEFSKWEGWEEALKAGSR